MCRRCLSALMMVCVMIFSLSGVTEEKETAPEEKAEAESETRKADGSNPENEDPEPVAEEVVEETDDIASDEMVLEDGTETPTSSEMVESENEKGAPTLDEPDTKEDAPSGAEVKRSEKDTSSSERQTSSETKENVASDPGTGVAGPNASAETKSEEASTPKAEKKTDESSRKEESGKKYRKMITAGIGAPLCGFAYNGIIEGSGCANTSSDFLWGNIDLRFQFRLSEKFAVGGGLLQSLIYFDGFGVIGGHLVADFIWYAIPDYLYFKMDLFFGFPMFFALGPSMGHSFSVNEKVHIFIENQFLFMAVAGVYGFWQPTIGVSTRF